MAAEEEEAKRNAPTEAVSNVSDENMKTLMLMFKGLEHKMTTVETRLAERSTDTNGGGDGDRGTKRKTPDNPRFTRRTTTKYCWTHGGCAHAGKDCTRKAEGHQDTATFSNKMGGSKAFCD